MAGKLFVDYVQTESGTLYVQNYSGDTIFSANATGLYSPSGKTYISASGNITGNVIGNLTGTVTGNVTGNVVATTISTGSLTSNTSLITSGTSQNTTSGTAIDFTNIPAGMKRITVMLNGVSLSSTANLRVQLGTGGTPETTGYISGEARTAATSYSCLTGSGAGFEMYLSQATASDIIVAVFVNVSGNTWLASWTGTNTAGDRGSAGAGSKTLAGVLNMVRLTTTGTDTFDAGSVNILYE